MIIFFSAKVCSSKSLFLSKDKVNLNFGNGDRNLFDVTLFQIPNFCLKRLQLSDAFFRKLLLKGDVDAKGLSKKERKLLPKVAESLTKIV